MADIAVFSLSSPLHDAAAVKASVNEFLDSLSADFDFFGDDFSNYGSSPLSLIYVCTGGTESLFLNRLPSILEKSSQPIYLLTSGKSNSLAASMEILSFLRSRDIKGEIIHGDTRFVNDRINSLAIIGSARAKLRGARIGIIGTPSDWLISSAFNPHVILANFGIECIDIPISRLVRAVKALPEPSTDDPEIRPLFNLAPSTQISDALPGAIKIYTAIKDMIDEYHLSALTIRCFDLLSELQNTGCLALARLNAEGIPSSCEGDVPALISMMIANALFGISGFQANPSRINPDSGEILFAHCTIPLNMVNRFELDSHFESGIGVGIRGYVPASDITIFKVSGDLSRHFAAEGALLRCQAEPGLCRSQQLIQLTDKYDTSYFFTNPIGNHHIILPGHCKSILDDFFGSVDI